VACGQQHALALDHEGRVYSWGLGVFGQLGLGSMRDSPRPRLVEALAGVRMVAIACGSHHSLALDASGQVWTWGSSEYGQQGGNVANYSDWSRAEGRGQTEHNTLPRAFQAFQGRRVVRIACGHLFNAAVCEDGQVLTWGWGANGALGHGNRRFQLLPTPVLRLRGESIELLAAGGKHCIAVARGNSSTFAFDFKPFVGSIRFADIVVRSSDGKELPAHSCILFVRCPRLRAHLAFCSSRFAPSCAAPSAPAHRGLRLLELPARLPACQALLMYLYTDHVRNNLPSHVCNEVRWRAHSPSLLVSRRLFSLSLSLSLAYGGSYAVM
jgi:hypothetical protein